MNRFFDTYGPDLLLAGLLALVALGLAAVIDELSALVSLVPVLALVVARIIKDLRKRAWAWIRPRLARVGGRLGRRLRQLLAKVPAAKTIIGWAMLIAAAAAFVAVVAVGFAGHGAVGRSLMVAATVVAVTGISSQYGWFLGQAAAWKRDNG